MTLFRNFFSCVRGHRSHTHRRLPSSHSNKVRFGEPLSGTRKTRSHLPPPIYRLVTFLGREGTQTTDLFRRPGNIGQMTAIIALLAQGKPVNWPDYNLYTSANVAKKYLLNLPGGLFGRRGEALLLATLDCPEDDRISRFLDLVRQMVPATQELTILLFGILFRMVAHSVNTHQSLYHASPPGSAQTLADLPDVLDPPFPHIGCPRSPTEHSIESHTLNNCQTMLAEAVAKSVAGSLFHSCRDSPEKVERAAKVLENLILAFPSFDAEFIDFFDQAMNKMSYSTSSTISSHDMSASGSCKIVRKPSGLAASLEMWTESFGKGASQRSSLKDAEKNRYDRVESEVKRMSQVLHHNTQSDIPSITITGPLGEIRFPESLENDDNVIKAREEAVSFEKESVTPSFRHARAREQSMKRRQEANLKKRSDWFLNSSPVPASPIFRVEAEYGSCVVVTCGGSSICLGQTQPLVARGICLLMHSSNTSAIRSSHLTSSGPDLLQTTPGSSRPETPDYSMMSRTADEGEDDGGDSCYSLSDSEARLFDPTEAEVIPAASQQPESGGTVEVEAPSSAPPIRRSGPTRASISSRKASSPTEDDDDDDSDEDDENDFLVDDTQSDCY